MSAQAGRARPYIYELDLMRPVTAFMVVAVHVLAFTTVLEQTNEGIQVHFGLISSAHFTRAVFMFVTAFALTYVYYGKPFSARRFWGKRTLGVLIPYCLWSMAYTWANNPAHEPVAFAKAALFDIATGNASYQLYFIVLTLQLYLVLPLFLGLLRRIAAHPWWALSISFALELVLMYVDYHYVQEGPLASLGFWQIVNNYQNRFLLTYQFYFILGGMAALFLEPAREFILRRGKLVVGAFALALVTLWVHFFLQVDVFHGAVGLTNSVLQPIISFYSLGVIVFLSWLACRWARHAMPDGRPRGYRIWHALSDASFGVYLVHAFILTAVLRWGIPLMPVGWPAAIKIFLTWFLTAGSAAAVTLILLQIPILSRLVGRPAPRHSEWINRRFHRSQVAVPQRPGEAQHV
jgi:surface polysaccharide O-acyltransferase-like enzyme